MTPGCALTPLPIWAMGSAVPLALSPTPGTDAGSVRRGSSFVVGRSDHVVTNGHLAVCSERVVLGQKCVASATVRGHDADKDWVVLSLTSGQLSRPREFA